MEIGTGSGVSVSGDQNIGVGLNASQTVTSLANVSTSQTGISTSLTGVSGSLTALSTSVDARFAAVGLGGPQPTDGAVFGNGAHAGTGAAAFGFDAFAAGQGDTAIGNNAHVGADNGTAVGSNTSIDAAAQNATAIGAGASVGPNGSNSVALGAGSVANDANVVSVGSPGNERRIENVAPGVNGTDAANVNQVQAAEAGAVSQANAFTDSRFTQLNNNVTIVRNRADAGIASAMAAVNIPQAWAPGKTLIGLGAGIREGQGGFAIGASTMLPDGRTVVKASATYDTENEASAGVGVGWQF